MSLRPGVPVLGFVGRLAPDKGLETLAMATSLLKKSGLDFELLIVGREDSNGALSRALTRAGLCMSDIHWVGPVTDPRPYMGLMDLLALPTRREGFPNVVLEAAVEGVPSIVSNVTGAMDSVQPGVTGELFPVGDAVGLAEQVRVLFADSDRRERMAQSARDFVSATYRRELIWQMTHEFLEKLARESRRGKRR